MKNINIFILSILSLLSLNSCMISEKDVEYFLGHLEENDLNREIPKVKITEGVELANSCAFQIRLTKCSAYRYFFSDKHYYLYDNDSKYELKKNLSQQPLIKTSSFNYVSTTYKANGDNMYLYAAGYDDEGRIGEIETHTFACPDTGTLKQCQICDIEGIEWNGDDITFTMTCNKDSYWSPRRYLFGVIVNPDENIIKMNDATLWMYIESQDKVHGIYNNGNRVEGNCTVTNNAKEVLIVTRMEMSNFYSYAINKIIVKKS